MSRYLLDQCAPPRGNSSFEFLDSCSPFGRLSDRSLHYASAALEHLMLWADFAAPLKFHPQQSVRFDLRPTLALARAAIETAVQGVWLLDSNDLKECMRRHVTLVRFDWEEFRKSQADLSVKGRLKQQDAELLRLVEPEFKESEVKPLGHLAMLRQACQAKDIDRNPDDCERLWRAMCGAGHGMYWTRSELTMPLAGVVDSPTIIPDVAWMTESLKLADDFTRIAALKHIRYVGYTDEEIDNVIRESARRLGASMTFKPGTSEEEISRLQDGDF